MLICKNNKHFNNRNKYKYKMSSKDIDALKQRMFTEGVNKNTFVTTQDHYLSCPLDFLSFN